MKNSYNYLSTVTIQFILMLFFLSIKVTAQSHPLLNSNHIPLMGLHHSAWHGAEQKIPLYPKLREMGLEGVIFGDVSQSMFDGFENINDQMKLIPWQVHMDPPDPPVNFINEYTCAVYTVWQAHDTEISPLKAALKFNPEIGERDAQEPNTIRTKQDATEGRLITGPGYNQRIKYASAVNWSPNYIDYTATFNLKIEQNEIYPDPPVSTEGLTDPVCTLKVVVKEIAYQTGTGFYVKDSLDWAISEVLVNELEFGVWKKFNIQYNYQNLPTNFRVDTDSTEKVAEENVYADFVEFYIEWMGVDYARLYFDTLLVSDIRGQRLFDPAIEDYRNLIRDQASNFYNNSPIFNGDPLEFETTVAGFYGQDEPGSIDNLESVRKVGELMRDATNGERPLFISIAMSWNGKWGNSQFGIHPIDHNQEFYNRALPDGFLMQTHIYDNYNLGSQIWRIQTTYIPNLISLQSTAPVYSVLVQTAKWLPDVHVDPSPEQLRYSVYLALLYGAKGIFFDQVFAMEDGRVGGIINPYVFPPEYSPLYDEIKNNIYPRTNGWFGKTLRRLSQYKQFPNIDALIDPENTTPYEFVDFVHAIGGPNDTCRVDIGIFRDIQDLPAKYFMVVNRYYSDKYNFNIGLRYLTGYNNWKVTDYIDTTNFTIISSNGLAEFSENIYPGDTKLYSILPVVLYGGTLLANETAGEGQVLKGDMIIDNGATLTVNSTYNVYADIRVKAGGKIITTGNGTIKFYQGHKLIVEGAAILSGTTSNKLKLDFVTPEKSNGIIIKPGASLTISYCEIKNAVKGITSELNLYGLNIQNVNFVNCDFVAIYITGRNRLLEQLILTPPPPQIKYCNITNSDFGILVSNLSQIVIQQNQITGTDYGIYLSNVTTPAIINNIIYGTRAMPGIFLASCNGVVRGNQISGCSNAIHLGNSSPDIGGNLIEHNWNRGLYVGANSLPNMRGKLVQDPIHPNLFYAVSGYNYINENGGRTIEDDGSEIFINDANAILGDIKIYGCNEIKDQRIPNTEDTPPLYNTRLLMNCRGSDHPIEVHAGGNFWDEHPIYRLEERFGDCIVYLDPILSAPCLLPDGSGGKLFITSSTGEIIDTLYAEERTIGTLTETEQLYATAEEKFLTADFEGAELIYNQILNGNDSIKVKLDAYRRLYEAGKLLGKDETYFTSLRDTYSALAGSTNDSLLVKIFDQLSSLSLVANQEYVPAIEEYDAIIQQNPNTEEAVYAEIDALTTALLIEESDSTLQKGRLGKYLVKTSGDYNQRIDEILRKNFGSGSKETEKELLPTEYTLYQNYPNPFNPTTTIKYDLPNASEVSIIIYDILGRKVKELVNTKQQAGRYEVQFDASALASGVYIYQLRTKDFVNTKKMILLR